MSDSIAHKLANDKYHGKRITFIGTDPKSVNAFRNILPKRRTFLPPAMEYNNGHTEFLFQPHDCFEVNDRVGGYQQYVLLMIGIDQTGRKTMVKVTGIQPSFDVMVPENRDRYDLESELRKRYPRVVRTEYTSAKPLKFFQPDNSDWVRLYFTNNYERKKAIDGLGDSYIQGNNDPNTYKNLLFRNHNIQAAGWNVITDYELSTGAGIPPGINPNLDYYVVVDYRNIRDLALRPGFDINQRRDLINENTLIVSEDIETYSSKHDNVPSHSKRDTDQCFMLSQAYGFRHQADPFLIINFTTLPAMRYPTALTVVCDTERSIYTAQAIVMGALLPDYLAGFNSGCYDELWKLSRLDPDNYYRDASIILPEHPYFQDTHRIKTGKNKNITQNITTPVPGYTMETIKIEAGKDHVVEQLRLPGCIPVDVRPMFMKLYPKANKSSLAFYLSLNGLQTKEDMPYTRLHAIRKLCLVLSRRFSTTNLEVMRKQVDDLITKHGAGWQELLVRREELDRFWGAPYNLGRAKLSYISSLLNDVPKVARYCDVDSILCHKLLHKRNIIADRRDVCRMSYNDMYDAIYRADGAKIINLVLGYAYHKGYYSDNRGDFDIKNHEFAKYTKEILVDEEVDMEADNADVAADKANPPDPLAGRNTGDKRRVQKVKRETVSVRYGELKYPGAFVTPPHKGLYRDTRTVKAMRRIPGRTQKELAMDPLSSTALTDIDMLLRGIKPSELLQDFTNIDNDTNILNDRPSAGLDFSSLYPSADKTINGSPDKIVDHRRYPPKLHFRYQYGNYLHEAYSVQINGVTYYCRKVDYYFKDFENLPPGPEREQFRVVGYLISDCIIIGRDSTGRNIIHKDPALFGIIPQIFEDLGKRRSAVKKQMAEHDLILEFLEKLPHARRTREGILTSLDEIQTTRENLFARTKKAFFADQISAIKQTRKYLERDLPLGDSNHTPTAGSGDTAAPYTDQSFAERVERVIANSNFYKTYYNSLQNAIKVFMNSIYGKLGDKSCPFYDPIIAGGVTTMGVKLIKSVRSYVLARGYRVLYGDTDSLYICAPESAFWAVDAEYEAGKITKLEYWTAMVEITMDRVDAIKSEVAIYLHEISGGYFLAMAYEEVVFPGLYGGMKKYIAVQHQNIVNFRICQPDCTLEEFTRSKSLFIRGLELTKRGGSDFMRKISYAIFLKAFSLQENRSLRDIVHGTLAEVKQNYDRGQYMVRDFICNIKYKPQKTDANGNPQLGKKGHELGNAMLVRFNRRMQLLAATNPEIGLPLPVSGENIAYVVVDRSLDVTDILGKKTKRAKGDMIEYAEALENKKYIEYLGFKPQINIDYYVTNELAGQLGRYMTYAGEYNTHFRPEYYEDNALYKAADKKAKDAACKILQQLWRTHYASRAQSVQLMPKFKQVSALEHSAFTDILHNRLGEASSIITNNRFISNLVLNMEVVISPGGYKISNNIALRQKIINAYRASAIAVATKRLEQENFWSVYYNNLIASRVPAERVLQIRAWVHNAMYLTDKHVDIEKLKLLYPVDNSVRQIIYAITKSRVAGTEVVIRNTQILEMQKIVAVLDARIDQLLQYSAGYIKAVQDIHEINLERIENSSTTTTTDTHTPAQTSDPDRQSPDGDTQDIELVTGEDAEEATEQDSGYVPDCGQADTIYTEMERAVDVAIQEASEYNEDYAQKAQEAIYAAHQAYIDLIYAYYKIMEVQKYIEYHNTTPLKFPRSQGKTAQKTTQNTMQKTTQSAAPSGNGSVATAAPTTPKRKSRRGAFSVTISLQEVDSHMRLQPTDK